MQVEIFVKTAPTKRVLFTGWTREELLKDLPRLAAALDIDLTDLDAGTLVVRNVRT